MAWLAVWLGYVSSLETLWDGLWGLVMLPVMMLMLIVWGGMWMVVTVPLVIYLAYRALDFIRGEGEWRELVILLLLSFFVCLPVSAGLGVHGAMVIGGLVYWVYEGALRSGRVG